MGKTAEERVFARLREALPAPYRLYPNVRWLGKADAGSPARDGETDLLIVHPEHGLLIIETKGGRIRRDADGRWWSGEHRLDPPPFTQAESSKRNLTRKLTSLPDWPGTPTDLRAGHAVALPDVSARTTATRALGLGPDTDLELVIDQVDLESVESARKGVDRAYDFWLGDRRRGSELSGRQLELIDELLAPTVELAPLLRPEVEDGEREVVRLTEGQMHVLGMLRGQRRAAVVGPAGSGKTMRASREGAPAGERRLLDAARVLQPAAGADAARRTGRCAGAGRAACDDVSRAVPDARSRDRPLRSPARVPKDTAIG